MPKKGTSKWNDEKILNNLKSIIKEIGHFPCQAELLLKNHSDLASTITKNGGVNKFRTLLNYEIIKKSKGYWTDEKIYDELKSIINILDHFPIRKELISINRYDLICAISQHGGFNKFRILFGCDLFIKPKNYWIDEKILKELHLIIEKINHFPTLKELIKMDRNDLIGAIN